MTKSETTSPKAASAASKTLKNSNTGTHSKTAAGSALGQTKAPEKQTSGKAGTSASKTMSDDRTSSTSKTAASSALSQRPDKGKKA
ncbi:MAG: hypothetical protein EOO81_03260 [Oxalobacteraceae bacterium]|nr:MAG: hypothetical protein EOO81_03260 [Oxalobacteraceae bacterium]